MTIQISWYQKMNKQDKSDTSIYLRLCINVIYSQHAHVHIKFALSLQVCFYHNKYWHPRLCPDCLGPHSAKQHLLLFSDTLYCRQLYRSVGVAMATWYRHYLALYLLLFDNHLFGNEIHNGFPSANQKQVFTIFMAHFNLYIVYYLIMV